MSGPRVFLVFVLLAPSAFWPATAAGYSCETVASVILRKTQTFRALKEAEEVRRGEVGRDAKACQQSGSSIAGKAAAAKSGQICRSREEARKLDTELRRVGENCAGRLQGLHLAQKKIRRLLAVSWSDLQAATMLVGEGSFLATKCPREVAKVKDMKSDFSALEKEILGADVESALKAIEFARFRQVAEGLERAALAQPARCDEVGEKEGGLPLRAPASVPVSGAPAPKGQGKRRDAGASGLSGIEKSLRNKAEDEKALAR